MQENAAYTGARMNSIGHDLPVDDQLDLDSMVGGEAPMAVACIEGRP